MTAPPLSTPLDDPTEELDRLASIAEAESEESRLRLRLTELLEGHPVDLEIVAGRSYLHANGFAKIVLSEEAPGEATVRLHVWEASTGPTRRGESDPHAHRWQFVSTVVVGEGLDVVHFADQNVGPPRPGDHEVFRFEYDHRSPDAMHPRGPWRLRPTSSARRSRHDLYRCDVDLVHAIEPASSGVVATIVVQGPPRSRSVPVYRYTQDPSLAPRLPLTVDQLALFLELVVEGLSRSVEDRPARRVADRPAG